MNNQIQPFEFEGNKVRVFDALAAALKPMNTTKDIADNCGIKEGTLAYWRSGHRPEVREGRTNRHVSEGADDRLFRATPVPVHGRIRGRGRCAMTDNDWRTDTPWPDPWEEKEDK